MISGVFKTGRFNHSRTCPAVTNILIFSEYERCRMKYQEWGQGGYLSLLDAINFIGSLVLFDTRASTVWRAEDVPEGVQGPVVDLFCK